MEPFPDEINVLIVSRLTNRSDLANYRLTCKDFARIGAEPYFERFAYGKSPLLHTLQRVYSLAASPYVKHVNHLDYNEKGWLRGIKKRHKRCNVAKKVIQILWDAGARIETLQAQGMYDVFFLQPVDDFAQWCAHLKQLTFRYGYYERCNMYKRNHILRAEGHMRELLMSLEGLEVLSADCVREGGNKGPRELLNIFSISHTWPNLRELHLAHFYTGTQDLITILSNHANTLVCVRFVHMSLIPIARGGEPREWWRLFQQLGRMNVHQGSIYQNYEKQGREFQWVMHAQSGIEVNIRTDVKHYLDDYEAYLGNQTGEERFYLLPLRTFDQ